MALEEKVLAIYLICSVSVFCVGSIAIKKSEKSRIKTKSPTSTDELILFWLLVSATCPLSMILIISLEISEYLDRNSDPYIIPYGIKVYEKDLRDVRKLEKKLFGDKAGQFPFVIEKDTLVEFKNKILTEPFSGKIHKSL